MKKNLFSKKNIHKWAVKANEEQRAMMDSVSSNPHPSVEDEEKIIKEQIIDLDLHPKNP